MREEKGVGAERGRKGGGVIDGGGADWGPYERREKRWGQVKAKHWGVQLYPADKRKLHEKYGGINFPGKS